jgi:hypothetical protein
MIITTSPVRSSIPPARVSSVEPSGFVAAAGDPSGVDWGKWMGRNGNQGVALAAQKCGNSEPAIVFRPQGRGTRDGAARPSNATKLEISIPRQRLQTVVIVLRLI